MAPQRREEPALPFVPGPGESELRKATSAVTASLVLLGALIIGAALGAGWLVQAAIGFVIS